MKTKRTSWIMASVLAISILVPNAAAQSDQYPKMAGLVRRNAGGQTLS